MKIVLTLGWLLTNILILIESNYVTNLKLVKLCENPELPYVTDKPMIIKLEMYKKKDKSLIRGNITVNASEPTKEYYWSFVGLIENNGKIKKVIDTKGFKCKHPLAFAILLAIKVPFDRNNCKIRKGFYKFDNIDVDAIDHTISVIPVRAPGFNMYVISMYNATGTIFCLEIHSEIVFLRGKH